MDTAAVKRNFGMGRFVCSDGSIYFFFLFTRVSLVTFKLITCSLHADK